MEGNGAGLGAALLSFLCLYDRKANYIPFQISDHLATFFHKVVSFVNPYNEITIHEYCGEHMNRDELYATSQAYLSSTCSSRDRKLKADLSEENDKLSVTIDDCEEVIDTFRGVRVNSQTISFYPNQDQRKYTPTAL